MQATRNWENEMIFDPKEGLKFTWSLKPTRLPWSPTANSGSCSRHSPAASFLADTVGGGGGGSVFRRSSSSSGSPPPWFLSLSSAIFNLDEGVSGLLRLPAGVPLLLKRVSGVLGFRREVFRCGRRSKSREGAMPAANGGGCRWESPEIFIVAGKYRPFKE